MRRRQLGGLWSLVLATTPTEIHACNHATNLSEPQGRTGAWPLVMQNETDRPGFHLTASAETSVLEV